jgi:galactonate dehydratase
MNTEHIAMKITGAELFFVEPRWLFLKLSTDAGIAGWGEPVVEGRAATVAAAVEEATEYLVGRDPDAIEDLWQVLFRGGFYRGGPVLMSAIAGIDQALWDIKGKRYDLPVYQFLGGQVRERIKVYSWIGGDTAEDIGRSAQERVAAGFTALKMGATEELQYIDSFAQVEVAVRRVGAAREAVGSGIGIGVDFHGRVHKGMAKVLAKELEPLHLLFIEEPVLPEHNEALRDIAAHTSIPIATGERMFSRWDFKKILQEGYVDILQPDLSHAGGISEVRRIAAMAEAYDVAVAPHCPLGPIALAASLQIDATTPNFLIQEQSLGIHYNQANDLLRYLADPAVFGYVDGYVPVPTGPGLGITINEEAVREAAQRGHRWRSPLWRTPDGAVAEW